MSSSMPDDRDFFSQLASFDDITEIVNPQHYADVPTDWYVALTDVRGSTRAIEEGRYKEVNGIAAASITALLNCASQIELPFVFGGDGATVLIPPIMLDEARQALQATQALAQTQFQLTLRAGIIPVSEVLALGGRIRVAKLRYSDNFQQAIFMGGGLSIAERLLKDPATSDLYSVQANPNAQADFSGFECRWSAIPSSQEETVALLVTATQANRDSHTQVYRDVLAAIERIYGNMQARNPLIAQNMHVARHPRLYRLETGIRWGGTGLWARLKLMLYSLAGYVLWHYRQNIWNRYRQVVIEATDREKFDDALRMIIAGSPAQRGQLRAYLDEQRKQGRLVYGTHVAHHALMTCLVFDRFGKQVHFLDGDGGGYALAAKEMKAQLSDSKRS